MTWQEWAPRIGRLSDDSRRPESRGNRAIPSRRRAIIERFLHAPFLQHVRSRAPGAPGDEKAELRTWNLLSPRWGLEHYDSPQTRGSRLADAPGFYVGHRCQASRGGSFLPLGPSWAAPLFSPIRLALAGSRDLSSPCQLLSVLTATRPGQAPNAACAASDSGKLSERPHLQRRFGSRTKPGVGHAPPVVSESSLGANQPSKW